MNEIIMQQLKNLKVARLPEFNNCTTELIIKKLDCIILKENHCYLIKLNSDILLNKDSTLATNWNNGDIPKYKYYKIDVIKIMAQMIKVNGIAFDYDNNIDINDIWSGWLPINNIEILNEI